MKLEDKTLSGDKKGTLRLETQLPLSYWKKVVMNSVKNEYRQNANARKHMIPFGIDLSAFEHLAGSEDDMEVLLNSKNLEDWLQMIDNENLYAGLCSLKRADQEFVFTICVMQFTQREMAEHLGVRQNAVHKRWRRIIFRLRKFF